MNKLFLLMCCACWVAISASQVSAQLFPAKDQADLPLVTPPDAQVQVDTQGNLRIEGRVRYLVGTQFVDAIKHDLQPLPGYDQQYDWLYNGPVDYTYARRLGFDSVGFFMPSGWMRKHDPKVIAPLCTPELEDYQMQVIGRMRLPLYVDFTCMPWGQGLLAKSPRIDPAAVNTAGQSSQGNHWTAYNIITPQGRAMYHDMWAYGAQQVQSVGGKPLFYELFNEPAYSEVSPLNRQAFLKVIYKDYTDIDELNRTWGSQYKTFEQVIEFRDPTDHPGLYVHWCKFLENAFTSLCQEGVQTIREIDSRDDAMFTVQTLGSNYARVVPLTHVNMYDISQVTNSLLLPTSGGLRGWTHLTKRPDHAVQTTNITLSLAEGILQRHLFRAIAVEGNKPIFNGEAYGHGSKGIRNMYWLDMMRGSNGCYLFSWNKRAWDKLWSQPGGGQKLAEKYPYMRLNIHGNTTESLTGPMQFKKELVLVNDLVVPRQNRPASRIALLFSFPTERYSQAVGSPAHHLIRQYAAALDLSHYSIDVIFEEQLPKRDLSQYKMIVAAGIQNTYPQTLDELTKYVQRGGIIFIGQEPLAQNEYGLPQQFPPIQDLKLAKPTTRGIAAMKLNFAQSDLIPGELKAKMQYSISQAKSWQVLATLQEQSALIRKAFGKGHVYYLAAHMPDYALASLLGGVVQRHQLNPKCRLTRTDDGQLTSNVEVHLRKAGNLTACFMFNHDAYPKLARLEIEAMRGNQIALVDPIAGRLHPIDNGQAVVLIEPEDRLLVVCGPQPKLEKQFGNLPPVKQSQLEQELKHFQNRTESKSDQPKFTFDIDTSKAVALDLKPFANRGFKDRVAGDRKGGWTDQGENSLHGVPWGLQSLLGVPFELIRFDENFEKTCIVLRSQHMENVPLRVDGIPVNMQAKTIYFLGATAWTVKGKQAMQYVIHYEDGTQTTVPIVCGKQMHDWWIKRDLDPDAVGKLAWKNSQKRGLYAYAWPNPHPDRVISSIDIVSSNGDPIPITVAITVEQP